MALTISGPPWVVEIPAPPGGAVDIANMTAAGTAATAGEKTAFLESVNGAEFLAPRPESADFTLTAANHANRRTDCTKGTAQAVTWDTGHGMADGDSGRLMQVGAGAITITKAGGFTGGELKLATGVASATTVNDGDVLDWEYDATGERLLITYRSAAASGGGAASVIAAANDQSVVLTGGEDVVTSFVIPGGAIGANGFVSIKSYMDRTTGTNTWTPRLRLGNATTGMIINSPGSAITSRVAWEGSFFNLGAQNSQHTLSVGAHPETGTSLPNTGSVDTSADVTVYLTAQGTASEVVRSRFLRAVVFTKN